MMGQSGWLESFWCRKAVAQLTEHCIKCMTGTVVVIPAQAGIQVASARSGGGNWIPPKFIPAKAGTGTTVHMHGELCNPVV